MENKKTSSMYFKERHALLIVECFRETGHFVVDVLNDAPAIVHWFQQKVIEVARKYDPALT